MSWFNLIVGYMILVYIVAPVLVRRKFALTRAPLIRSDSLPPFPADFLSLFTSVRRALEDLGFTFVTHLQQETGTRHFSFYGLFWNYADKNSAILFGMYQETSKGLRGTANGVEFGTKYTNGLRVSTSNSSFVNTLKPLVRYEGLRLPHEQDLRRLYAIHQWRLAPLGSGLDRFIPAQGAEADHVQQVLNELVARQLEAHYFQHDPKRNQYRLTWKGAFLTTWPQMIPVRWIYSYFHRQEVKKTLRQFEMQQV